MNRFITMFAAALLILSACQNEKPVNSAQTKADTTKAMAVTTSVQSDHSADSLQLTKLVKELYKWHETTKLKHTAYSPVKNNPADTLYSGIDLKETEQSVEEIKATGFFSDDFLNQYRNIAIRIDKELKDGSSTWRDGEIPTFDNDADPWCKCQDTPRDDFWNILKFSDFKYNGNEASFKWNWGDDSFYHVKAQKTGNDWKISYLEGFDMNFYNWEWNKKHPAK